MTKTERHLTWMILKKDNKILLGLKKRGFGVGKLNGVGGKVEPGESVEEAALRETFEEIGVRVTKMEAMGEVIFDELYYKNVPERNMMHIFVATEWEGEPSETDEIAPQWVEINKIPYDRLWEDDQYWLPGLLRGIKQQGYFRYDSDNKMLEHEVYPIPEKIVVNLKDSDFGLKFRVDPSDFPHRKAARAILMDENNCVALIYAANRGYYKLPGGGIDDGELIREALHREVIEEAGYEIDILEEVGLSLEERRKFRQYNESYCYICRAKKFVGAQLMEDEAEDGFELRWFDSIDDAIAAVAAIDTTDMIYQAKFFTARELALLKVAKEVLKKHGK